MPSQRVEIPIARRHGVAKSKFVSSQMLGNAFLELNPETGEPALYGAPGLDGFAEIGDGPIRGLHDFQETTGLAVSGEELYSFDEDGNETLIGTVEGTDPVIIADNGTQAAIVSDQKSYVYEPDGSTTFGEITDPDFQRASSCDFLDQYIIFTIADTGQFQLSDLANTTSFNALDIATAETRPDKLVRVVVDNREALMMGRKTTEGWRNAGDPDFPLVRDQSVVEYGLAGKHAVARADNTIIWLANDNTVRALRAGSPQIISDPWVCTEIERWTNPGQARAFAYTLRGHIFFVLRHPDGCLIWDSSLPPSIAWSSRKSYGSPTWRVGCGLSIFGKTIVGDHTTNKLYELSADVYDEDGDPIVLEIVSRTMGPGGRPFTCDCIEVEIEPGVGLVTGQGSDPQVWLQVSRDSGYTYGARMQRSIGAIGVRPKRIQWRDLGDFPPHGGVIKLGCSDPVARVITKAWADIEPLAL